MNKIILGIDHQNPDQYSIDNHLINKWNSWNVHDCLFRTEINDYGTTITLTTLYNNQERMKRISILLDKQIYNSIIKNP